MIGKTISHFRIERPLGAGGMGEVYLAEDTNLHRKVALKVLSKQLAVDPKGRDMLFKEARTASRLSHPAIATVYEVDVADGTPFIAMELVPGKSLRDLLDERALAPETIADIARQVADGLAEAHRAGVLHRDIKPGNVMVDERRRAKILDFGLAVLTRPERKPGEDEDDFVSRTATQHTSGGTVPYMAPEQLRGEAATAGSDIFAFGVLLYESLAGRLPFHGQTAIDTLHAILHDDPEPIRSIVPEVSPEWERLIENCLAKAPQHRPGSMTEVLSILERSAATSDRTAAQQHKSLAVLYFENLSRDEEDEYFRDGITEDIIIELSKLEGLKVFPRSAVLAYRDTPKTVPQIGQELGATHVLSGSLRRAGDRLRITAQLVESRSGHSAWAERYDRQMEDVFAIQDEIAQAIAGEMELMLTPKQKESIKKPQTADVQAYDYYLKGRQFFHQFRRQGFEFARQMFARAIVLDPEYARAYAGVADCCSYLYMYFEANETNLREAESASKKAIELDPDLAEAHVSRALAATLRNEYDEAMDRFERAIELNPGLFEAYYFYARARFTQGELEEAVRLYRKAAEVDPDDYQAAHFLAATLKTLDRDDEALEAHRACADIIRRHLDLHPDHVRALYLGAGSLAEIGETDTARQWLDQALALDPDPDDSAVLYNFACVYANLGEIERAIECLEKSVATGGGSSYKDWMERDPDLEPVRSDPRYQRLLEKL